MRLPIDVKGSLSDEALFEVKDIKTLIDTAKSTKQSRIESKIIKLPISKTLQQQKQTGRKPNKDMKFSLKTRKLHPSK